MVNEVSDITKLDWHKVFEMPIMEFLNISCYIKDKNNWEKAQQEKWKRAH